MNDFQPSPRYPDPSVVSIDPSFEKYRLGLAKVERIATGMRWCEGPVWLGDMRSLVWSDVPGNCMHRWDEETGATSVFRKPSNNSNGNTRDRQGRIVTCEHLTRRVTRTVTLAANGQTATGTNSNELFNPAGVSLGASCGTDTSTRVL